MYFAPQTLKPDYGPETARLLPPGCGHEERNGKTRLKRLLDALWVRSFSRNEIKKSTSERKKMSSGRKGCRVHTQNDKNFCVKTKNSNVKRGCSEFLPNST